MPSAASSQRSSPASASAPASRSAASARNDNNNKNSSGNSKHTSSTSASSTPINIKLLLIGNSSVGKSSLLLRFADEQWLPEDEASTTIGVDFRVHKMEIGGRKVKLSIWDTAGQERFRTITSSYYRGAQGIILVYDVSNRESFEALPRWYSELRTYVNDSVVKMVVGNKVDKEFSREVPTPEGRAFAERMDSLFLETSAKTFTGVREAFTEAVEQILQTPELWASVSSVVPDRKVVLGEAAGASTRGDGGEVMPGALGYEEASGCSC